MAKLKSVFTILGLLTLFMLVVSARVSATPLSFENSPTRVLQNVPFEIKIKNSQTKALEVEWSGSGVSSEGKSAGLITVPACGTVNLGLRTSEGVSEWSLALSPGSEPGSEISGQALPGWVSLLPPLVAIGLALATKQVLLSLIMGIFSGALVLKAHLFLAFTATLDTFLVEAITNKDHAFILLFTMALGGMVSLVSASGGMQGMVDKMTWAAKTPASTQIVTWLMGVAIFFDDYANTLLVGQTMKPVTDRQKISREKLAYIVDSTAAPIASIALISTWIGYEMSLIEDGLKALSIDQSVYSVFLDSIAHRYYAIFTLVFVFAIAYLHRDFGPMLTAERRALTQANVDVNDTNIDELTPSVTWGRSALDAVVPVGVVLFGTIAGLVYTGLRELGFQYPTDGSAIQNLGTLISKGNSFEALLWAAAAGGLIAALIIKLRYSVSLEKITDVYVKGVGHMLGACIVLVLAWAIGNVCEALFTGPYLVELCQGILSPRLLPTVTFVLSGAVAFSTGTSWGTMAIVMPLAIRLAHQLPIAAGMEAEISQVILISTIAGVLAGSTFGDHCSPISDTTIMSSLASGCGHIEHVRTQAPYALVTAGLAIVLGSLPAAYGVSPWLLNILGSLACFAVVRWIGKPVIVTTTQGDES